MDHFVVQGANFCGQVSQSTHSNPPFYTYSLWRTSSGEHLFDGAAGDLTEAMETLRAYMDHLTSGCVGPEGSS